MSERSFSSMCSNPFKLLALAVAVVLVMIGFVLAFANANPLSGTVGTSEEGNGSSQVAWWGLLGSLLLLIGSVIGYAFNWSISSRRIHIENVTKERAKWRKKIRDRALKVHDAIMSKNERAIFKLKCEFKTLLNPGDPEDEKIIKCFDIEESMSNEQLRERAQDFANLVAALLKHDWERAKAESAGLWKRVCGFRFLCFLKHVFCFLKDVWERAKAGSSGQCGRVCRFLGLWVCEICAERRKPDCPSLDLACEREAQCKSPSPEKDCGVPNK